MSVNRTGTRADYEAVTAVLSSSYSRTQPCTEDVEFTPISPHRADDMGTPLAFLQEVVWETYNGLNGPNTLLKEVEYGTTTCVQEECDGEGWKDSHGDTICEECGAVLNRTPMLLPERYDGAEGYGDGGKAALNPAQPSEPNVQ